MRKSKISFNIQIINHFVMVEAIQGGEFSSEQVELVSVDNGLVGAPRRWSVKRL